jgi:D-alanyl-D-alanine carboxypeptidase
MWEDTTRLLDFGYEHYRWQKVVEKDQPLKTAAVKKGVVDRITLVAGESAGMPLKENEQELLKYSFVMQEPLTAPLKAGQRVGMLHIYFGQTVVKEVPLLACETVEKRGLGLIFRRFFSWLPFVQ